MRRHAAIALMLMTVLLATLFAACSTGAVGREPTPEATRTPAPARPTATAEPRPPTVVLDPGHGGDEVGAANHGLVEKHSNLDMALRVERLLQAQGVRVILTRRDDARVAQAPGGASTFGSTRFDLQARIDMANAEGADLFLSIHSNGSTASSERGVEVWFDPNREFGDQNRAFAQSLLHEVIGQLALLGHAVTDRGIKDDTCFRQRNGRCFPLFLLGPPRITTREEIERRGLDPEALGFPPGQDAVTTRATQMPAALVELLFISNAADAAILADEPARDAMARGVANALLQQLGLARLG